MQTYHLPYGKTVQTLTLSDDIPVTWIDPADINAPDDPAPLLREALDNPIGSASWQAFRSARSVAIAINDNTRPVPHGVLLPPLLEKLANLGFPREAIRFFIANGTHAPLHAEQYAQILPEAIVARYSILSHNCDDTSSMQHLGQTPAGTPVWVNAEFYQSDLRIVVGNIEPHHFAGFSGGVKTAAIGLAGRETINANHILLLEPNARAGAYAGNPLREDIEQIGRMMGVHLAFNVVMNARKAILAAYLGDPLAVMAAGIPISRKVSQTVVDGPFDIVISSPGGHPKDINFYQAQKGITHAASIVKPGGTIILCAACPEGSGSQGYERYMADVDSHAAVLEKFRRVGFAVGPHKAIQVALISQSAGIMLVSSIADDLTRRLLLTPAESLQSAVDRLAPGASTRIAILPHATNTIPIVVGN